MVVSRTSRGHMEWLEAIFKITEGAQEVSRVIIRSSGDDVDHIKKGRVILYRENSEDFLLRAFEFEPDKCVVAINYSDSGFSSTEKVVIQNTSKIKIFIDEVRQETNDKRSLKVDLFIKKKLSY